MSTTGTPGPGDDLTIDGVSYPLPNSFEAHDTLGVTTTPTMGRPRGVTWWHGDGLPNVQDRMEWSLSYNLGEDQSSALALLGRLRTKGGVRLFADWKPREYTWTARSGQQYFYLPRQDAYSLQYTSHDTSAFKAVAYVKVSATGVETALTVVYKATVASGDVVPAGELWISNTTEIHARAGFTVVAFKVGTTLAIGDEIRVAFHPLYRIIVLGVATAPFTGETVGLETRLPVFAEAA